MVLPDKRRQYYLKWGKCWIDLWCILSSGGTLVYRGVIQLRTSAVYLSISHCSSGLKGKSLERWDVCSHQTFDVLLPEESPYISPVTLPVG